MSHRYWRSGVQIQLNSVLCSGSPDPVHLHLEAGVGEVRLRAPSGCRWSLFAWVCWDCGRHFLGNYRPGRGVGSQRPVSGSCSVAPSGGTLHRGGLLLQIRQAHISVHISLFRGARGENLRTASWISHLFLVHSSWENSNRRPTAWG